MKAELKMLEGDLKKKTKNVNKGWAQLGFLGELISSRNGPLVIGGGGGEIFEPQECFFVIKFPG